MRGSVARHSTCDTPQMDPHARPPRRLYLRPAAGGGGSGRRACRRLTMAQAIASAAGRPDQQQLQLQRLQQQQQPCGGGGGSSSPAAALTVQPHQPGARQCARSRAIPRVVPPPPARPHALLRHCRGVRGRRCGRAQPRCGRAAPLAALQQLTSESRHAQGGVERHHRRVLQHWAARARRAQGRRGASAGAPGG
jgi:hypothetical protein